MLKEANNIEKPTIYENCLNYFLVLKKDRTQNMYTLVWRHAGIYPLPNSCHIMSQKCQPPPHPLGARRHLWMFPFVFLTHLLAYFGVFFVCLFEDISFVCVFLLMSFCIFVWLHVCFWLSLCCYMLVCFFSFTFACLYFYLFMYYSFYMLVCFSLLFLSVDKCICLFVYKIYVFTWNL